jgi:16S rRNA processing protein RimM
VDRDTVLLAEVDRVRGLQGEVVATLHADDPSRLDELGSVQIVLPGGAARTSRILGWKRRGHRVVLKLEGIDTVEAARGLSGAEIRVPKPEAPEPPKTGGYFAYQLEGLKVWTSSGAPLGEVVRVLCPAGQTLLEIRGGKGEILIPLVAAICKDIDLELGRIVVDPPEGLIELNEV